MQRPTVVTIFSVLNIVFAALGIIGVLTSLMLFTAIGTTSNNPVIQLIHDNPAYAAWTKISIALGLLAAAALLAAGIGLLKLQPWARMLSIVYAIYAIVMGLVGGVINYMFLIQPMLQQAQHSQGPQAVGAAIGGAVGGMVGGCFGLIYPVLLLIFMLRANVAAAFRSAANPAEPPPLPPG
jgi:hypothetical protein